MKTVVLSGYYGFDNAGDEALLAAISSTLREYAPDLRIIVLSASPARTQQLYGEEAVSRVNPLLLVRTLRQADLLISGGGSLLQDVTSWRSILYYLGVVALARWLGTPVMFYAQGIGPIQRPWARRLTRIIANRVQLITLRDEDSRRELQLMGVTQPPILVTADPVLGMSRTGKQTLKRPWPGSVWPELAEDLEAPEDEKGDRVNLRTLEGPLKREGQPKRVGFALRNWKDLSGYKIAVASAADYLAEQGWEIVFIPLQYPEDLTAAREAATKMHNTYTLMEGRSTVAEVIQEIARLDLLIGMRLHSLIFAATLGVPLLGISYDPKVTAFLEQLGEKPVGNVENLTPEQLTQGIQAFIQRLPEARSHLRQKTTELAELARNNAQMALELISPATAPPPHVQILGAKIDRLDLPQTLERIADFIVSGRTHHVLTLNAEILDQAASNPTLLELINQADLVTPDGSGIVWASHYLGDPVPERVTGIDLVLALVPLAAAQKWKLFFLGGAPGVAETAAQKLTEQFPKLSIVGTHHGYFKPDSEEELKVLEMIRQSEPDLLCVALGAPRQEFWIRQQIEKGSYSVPVSIGVGGSLDVIAGKVQRAPAWMRRFHLEWLGRLLREPWRWRRMLALPRFVLKVLRQGRVRRERRRREKTT